jgi:hypothetical protein
MKKKKKRIADSGENKTTRNVIKVKDVFAKGMPSRNQIKKPQDNHKGNKEIKHKEKGKRKKGNGVDWI